MCFKLYGQVSENDTADIPAFSRISDAADRHVNFSKAGTWWHCRLIINCILYQNVCEERFLVACFAVECD